MNLEQALLENIYRKSSGVRNYVKGENYNYELYFSSSYEEKERILKIIPGLRQRGIENLIINLKGYSGLIFVKTIRTKKGFLVELGFDSLKKGLDIWRKTEVSLEETNDIFSTICVLNMLPDMRGFERVADWK